jgi:hypothetical protein
MTYGFCPEDWPLFHSQIMRRRIEVADIERVEMRPDNIHSSVQITVVLRSGRVESWMQEQARQVHLEISGRPPCSL